MTDKEEIIRALSLWFRPGDVFEIRALGATSSCNRQEHTVSGYFDFEHIKDAAEAVCKLYGFRGVYATTNPVKPDLLARAVNRIRPLGRNDPTTADGDVIRRRWLLIDCDADRPAGISSTDAEHEAALAKVKEIRDGLTSLGWPEPIMNDSGNGAQLMYAIDLSADDDGLVKKCLESIAAASDDQVHVDLTVYNPARIWRIPGTMNCKGDNAEGFRPHRLARIIEAPTDLSTVTEEQLRSITLETAECSPCPNQPANDSTAFYSENGGFNLDVWIAEHCPDIQDAQPYKDGRKWIFPVCPFDANHSNRSAALFQNAAGAIGFRCLHNGCLGNDWRKLRTMLEPGCYDHREEQFPGVDISGILGQKNASKLVIHLADPSIAASNFAELAKHPKDEAPVIAEVPFPEELYDVPGFVNDVIKYDLDTAPSPNIALAFAGALSLQAHLAARKVEAPGGARTNPYIIVLGKSGVGKDHPRKINKTILNKAGLGGEVIDNVSSGQGLEDRLLVTSAILWQCDEFYAVLHELANDKSGQKENLMKALLTYFTSANMTIEGRAKAGRDPVKLDCPNLTLMGSCTPHRFFKSLNEAMLGHGMYGRMSIIHASKRERPRLPRDFTHVPPQIERKAKMWADYRPPNAGNMNFSARTVDVTQETYDLMDKAMEEIQEEYERLDNSDAPDWKLATWTRAFESMLRFSLIHACSAAESPETVVLIVESFEWARKFVLWETKNKIAMTDKYYHETEFAGIIDEIVEILEKWCKNNKGQPMPGWKFNRKTQKYPPNVMNAVTQSLLAQERITIEKVINNGKSALFYLLNQ